MSFVKKNQLNSFLNKLNKSKNKMVDRVANLIATTGEEIAKSQYAGTSIVVSQTKINNGRFSIIAKGKGIIFKEFGTGVVGKASSYKGKLPSSGIPITGRWQYYYPSKFKAIVNGRQGWWTSLNGKGHFFVGNVAENQMFNTSKYLKEYIQKELKGDLKGD